MGAIPLNSKILSAPGSPITGNSFDAPFARRSLFSVGIFSSVNNFSSAHFKSPKKILVCDSRDQFQSFRAQLREHSPRPASISPISPSEL